MLVVFPLTVVSNVLVADQLNLFKVFYKTLNGVRFSLIWSACGMGPIVFLKVDKGSRVTITSLRV